MPLNNNLQLPFFIKLTEFEKTRSKGNFFGSAGKTEKYNPLLKQGLFFLPPHLQIFTCKFVDHIVRLL